MDAHLFFAWGRILDHRSVESQLFAFHHTGFFVDLLEDLNDKLFGVETFYISEKLCDFVYFEV